MAELTPDDPLFASIDPADSLPVQPPSDPPPELDNLWIGSLDDDRMIGSHLHEFIVAELGDDFVNGKSGKDSLYGGEGSDTLCGGKRKDTIFGGSGADRFLVSRGRDLVRDFNVAEGDVIKGFTADAQVNHKFQSQRLVISEGHFKMVLTNIDRADYRELVDLGVLDFPDPILN